MFLLYGSRQLSYILKPDFNGKPLVETSISSQVPVEIKDSWSVHTNSGVDTGVGTESTTPPISSDSVFLWALRYTRPNTNSRLNTSCLKHHILPSRPLVGSSSPPTLPRDPSPDPSGTSHRKILVSLPPSFELGPSRTFRFHSTNLTRTEHYPYTSLV